MPRVHVLSEGLANRIAAGEVVERPASVVKELVENAVDAGAGRVEVELAEGGKTLIRVTDDGHGMSGEDAQLAVQRFATSKIQDAEDLDAIDTMGFRGEALPSIAAVSHFRLVTREPDNPEGCEIVIQGGSELTANPVGCPSGTTVEVKDLFFNTPARLKFLSASGRERGHCTDWVVRLALSRPDIAFKVTHNGDVVFNTSGAGDMRSVLAAVHGSTAARDFLPVDYEEDGVRVSGLISGPKLMRGTRTHQMFFVNRRFVRSRQISHALGEAYGLLLPAGKHPMCALQLTVDPERVDPNVHPTKIEVRFRRSGAVHKVVQAAAEQALSEAGFRSLIQGRRHVEAGDDPSTGPLQGQRDPFASPFGAPALAAGRVEPREFESKRRARRLRVNPFEDRIDERDEGLGVFAETPTRLDSAPDQGGQTLPIETEQPRVEVLGQLAERYIIAQGPGGLLVIDQHRAAERVLLEQLSPETVARQLLVTPETLQLSPTEAAAARESLEALAEMGYELEEFGGDTLLVRSVPAITAERGPVEALRNVIADLAEWDAPSSAERRLEKVRATVTCHAAVKAGERLRLPEMQKLVDDLMSSDSPAVCPHGDPIIVSMDLPRLDRQFGRLKD